jgi:hypothetical protein
MAMALADEDLRVLAAVALRWPVRGADCVSLERAGLVVRTGAEWDLTDEGDKLLLSHSEAGLNGLRWLPKLFD